MKWDMVKIKDVAKVTTGKTPPKSNKAYFGGDIPFITPAELGVGQYITPAKQTLTELATSVVKTVPENSILVCCIGSLGKLAISNQPVVTNQQINTVTFKEKVFPKFGYYALAQLKPILNAIAPATTVAIVSKSKFEELKIPLPPLEEQKRIAAILDKAHSIRQNRQQNLENADALIKSVFLDMFGDPVTNPKGWDKGTIRDVVKEVNYGTSKPANEQGKYVYLRMNNITYSGQLDLTSIKHIDVSDRDFIKYSVVKGDILFNRTNSKELVGKTCVFKSDTPMIIAGYIIRVRVNEKAIPDFLSATLNSAYGKSTLCGMCKSIIGQANINAQELQNIKTLIPPINLQNKFADIVQKIEVQKAKQQEHLHEAVQAFKALQQQFFG